MTIEQIKTQANHYADLYMASEEAFLLDFNGDARAQDHTPGEWAAMLKLAQLYVLCKGGKLDKRAAAERQRQLLEQLPEVNP